MKLLLAIFIGGGIGAVLRFLSVQQIHTWLSLRFPYGILTVNIVSSLLIGFLAVLFAQKLNLAPIWRSGILVGLLGGFSTFSSFSLDAVSLIDNGIYGLAILYIGSSIVLCLAATSMGMLIARSL